MRNWAMEVPKYSELLFTNKRNRYIPVKLLRAYDDGLAVVTTIKGHEVFTARVADLEMVAKPAVKKA